MGIWFHCSGPGLGLGLISGGFFSPAKKESFEFFPAQAWKAIMDGWMEERRLFFDKHSIQRVILHAFLFCIQESLVNFPVLNTKEVAINALKLI